MEEDFTVPHNSTKNCHLSVMENEKEKVKDFVRKHFREVTDGSLFNNAEDSSCKVHGSSTKKEKQTLNKAHCKIQQGAVFSGKILSFGCSVCKDNFTFSPNDLLKHFRAIHKGTLPTYPCDLCDFVTNEFPALQRHRIEHRNTLVTCELCNDDVQYSLLLLTRHYIMCHSLNGQFNCDWCEFTTLDAGTFVQHIHHHNENHWKCSKCSHISLTEDDHQLHIKAHTGTFPFTCPICGYGAAKSEYLIKHTTAVHKDEALRRKPWRPVEDTGTPASLKLLLKRSGDSQEPQKLNCLSGSFPNQNGRLITPEICLEETLNFMDGTGPKNDKSWSRVSCNTEKSTAVMLQECDNSVSSDAGTHSNANGLTVLMVKNKISLPPHCTTKVMGFKVVDGKKHLVLKVIPTEKEELSPQNNVLVDDGSSSTPNPVLNKSKESTDKEQCCDSKNSTSCHLIVSPRSGPSIPMDEDDIVAVKVKTEEEETSVCRLNSTPHRGSVGEQTNPLLNNSSTCANTLYSMANHFDLHHQNEMSYSEEINFNNSVTATSNLKSVGHSGSKSSNSVFSSPSNVTKETLPSKPAFMETVKNHGVTDELSDEKHTDKHGEISAFNTTENEDPSSQLAQELSDRISTGVKSKQGQEYVKHVVYPSQPSPLTSFSYRQSAVISENYTQNSPNQEVFSFHNYSKETFSTSPNTNQNLDNNYKHSTDKEGFCESSQLSLTLAPECADDCGGDEYTAVDNLLTEENPDSVLQDFNIIKIEEETIPISKNLSETNRNTISLVNSLEEHSNAAITQQLNTERNKSSSVNSDSSKQTKTTLRILQLQEGHQPVLLKAADAAMPMQVKSTPGFKLITHSANPQINVSYMKPGLERSTNTSGLILSPNSRMTTAPVAKPGIAEKGPILLAAVQPGSNQYIINNPGFTNPVLLSSTPHNTPTDKTTCYLVQRSVPFLQTPSAPGLRLGSTQLSLNSRPVLAMPLSSTDKPSTLQTGRQAFLLRYISPPKSGVLLNNQEAQVGTQYSQTSDGSGNKVIFKIVTPTTSHLTSGTPTSNNQSLLLATRSQTQCFLVSSNKTHATTPSVVKKMTTTQNAPRKESNGSCVSASQQMNVKVQPCEAEKPILAPRPFRPPSQRKRRRRTLFDELPPTVHKARRFSKIPTEKETNILWRPVAKEEEKTLRLAPLNSTQQIKFPRKYQPVVVLNHPDADIPEVASIMKVVNRYKGAVSKVSLSQRTVQALSELGAQGNNFWTKGALPSDGPRPRAVQCSVQERFVLKLKLRKKSKKKYEVVETLSGCRREPVMFDCWFCGRLFDSQEDWIGHGQRHLMEATRDWNKLF
ncbi:zinc finger protein 518A [Mugil cephalus]|uniref:zinc finger protein 518A n=1 Tax=Mugil cephalus TaxID=48193 RepID=UPI001FB79666|nr:zinc finger protein 518A [Mugil cephalus]XP_047464585.1 zinc finger protein 518A [Mugil cephalus]